MRTILTQYRSNPYFQENPLQLLFILYRKSLLLLHSLYIRAKYNPYLTTIQCAAQTTLLERIHPYFWYQGIFWSMLRTYYRYLRLFNQIQRQLYTHKVEYKEIKKGDTPSMYIVCSSTWYMIVIGKRRWYYYYYAERKYILPHMIIHKTQTTFRKYISYARNEVMDWTETKWGMTEFKWSNQGHIIALCFETFL